MPAPASLDENSFPSQERDHSRRVEPSTIKIAIGMTLRNNERYLPEALQSLLNQTYKDFGLVLVDDQSSDQTEVIARQFGERDERVTYFRNERHLGMVATWRRAFELTRGMYPSVEYFAWASDHDLWAPT